MKEVIFRDMYIWWENGKFQWLTKKCNIFIKEIFPLWCHRVAKTPPFISIAAVLHKFLQVDRLSWSQIPQDSRFHFTICQGKVCSSHNLGEHAVIKRRPLNTLQTFHLSKIAGMTNLAKEPCYWCRILVEFWWQIFTGLSCISNTSKKTQKNFFFDFAHIHEPLKYPRIMFRLCNLIYFTINLKFVLP